MMTLFSKLSSNARRIVLGGIAIIACSVAAVCGMQGTANAAPVHPIRHHAAVVHHRAVVRHRRHVIHREVAHARAVEHARAVAAHHIAVRKHHH